MRYGTCARTGREGHEVLVDEQLAGGLVEEVADVEAVRRAPEPRVVIEAVLVAEDERVDGQLEALDARRTHRAVQTDRHETREPHHLTQDRL